MNTTTNSQSSIACLGEAPTERRRVNSQSSIVNRQSLDAEIALIQHEDIRQLVRATLDAAPACFWTMPASSSGKYHPAISLGEGGLVRHTRAVVLLTRHLLEMQGITPQERQYSIAIAAAILHDCCKKADGEQHTAFDHPLRAGQLIATQAQTLWPAEKTAPQHQPTMGALLAPPEHTYAATTPAVRCIIDCVESHMGRWNFDSHTGQQLPRPLTPLQRLIHTADYLASRKNLLVTLEPQSGGSGTLADIA